MKISEMTNDQAANALIRICGPFENICNDEELVGKLEEIGKRRNDPVIKVVGTVLPAFVKAGLERHREDLYEIIAALQAVPASRIGRMNFRETLTALQESYDEILRDFFTRSAIARRISAKK